MMNTKTFVLGLGHQKCGTTWLYHYLSQSRRFKGGIKKEYHIWDALDVPSMHGQIIKQPFLQNSIGLMQGLVGLGSSEKENSEKI